MLIGTSIKYLSLHKRAFSQVINTVSLVLAFLVGLLPLNSSIYVHSWNSSVNENRFYIPLVERVPDSISIKLPCTIFDEKNYDWIIEFKGGTAFQINKDIKLGIVVGNFSRTATKELEYQIKERNVSNCVILIEYERQEHIILITQNGQTEKLVLSDESVVEVLNHIEVNPKFQDQEITVEIRTAPNSDVNETTLRLFLKYISILLIFITIIVNFRSFYLPKIQIKILRDKFFLITIFFLIFLNIILPPRIDDGWRIVEATVLQETNIYNNYLVPSPLPTGRLLANLNGIALDSHYFPAIRSFSVIALIIMWMIIYYTLKFLFASTISSDTIKIFTSFFIIFLSTAFFIGLRGEVYISLIFSVSILIIVLEKNISKPTIINLLFLCIVISLSIHQSGIVQLVVLLAYLLLNRKLISPREVLSSPFFAITTGASVIVLFDHNNIINVVRNSIIYSNKFDQVKIFGDVSTFNPVGEYERFIRVFSYGSQIFTFVFLLILTSFLYIVYLQLKFDKSIVNKNVIIILLSSFLALFFMPSKWAWYYLVFAPVSIIVFFYYLSNLQRRKIKSSDLLFFPLVFFVTLNFKSVNYSSVPNSASSKTDQSTYLSEFLGFNVETLLLLMLIVTLASYLKKFITNFRHYLFFIYSNIFVFYMFFLSTSLYPIISAYLNQNGWNYISQNAPLKNAYTCGMFSEFEKISNVVTTNLDFFPLFPCSTPLLFHNGIWDYPLNVIQNFNFLDQQRLAYGIELETRKCFDFNQPFNDFCLYQSKPLPKNSFSTVILLEKQY